MKFFESSQVKWELETGIHELALVHILWLQPTQWQLTCVDMAAVRRLQRYIQSRHVVNDP